MILVAGLTPAWQAILRFRTLHLGEVNRAMETRWCASGKVLNVGMALASLEVPSHTLAPVGGWSGAAIRTEFAERRLSATWTHTDAPTRICTTLLVDDGVTTELVENAAALTSAEYEAYLAEYQRLAPDASTVVMTGSLPKATPTTFYRDLLERTPCQAVLDVRGPELLAALPAKPRVVKPNREELAATVGRPLPDHGSIVDAMRELMQRGAQAVIVTDGTRAVHVAEGERVESLMPPAVSPLVNPIGCGDCLAAGVAWGLDRGETLLDAVRLGMAAAAENVTQLLPARLTKARVESLRQSI